jgi:hypothetical protein
MGDSMIVRKTEKIDYKRINVSTCKVIITTWWILFIPVYSTEKILTYT